MRLSLLARKLGIKPSVLIDFFEEATHGNTKLEDEQVEQAIAEFGPLMQEEEESHIVTLEETSAEVPEVDQADVDVSEATPETIETPTIEEPTSEDAPDQSDEAEETHLAREEVASEEELPVESSADMEESAPVQEEITEPEEHLDVAHFQTEDQPEGSSEEDEEAAHVADAEEVDVDPEIAQESDIITTSTEVEPVKSKKVKVMEVSELLELAEKEAQEREEAGEITDDPEQAADDTTTDEDVLPEEPEEEVLIKAPKVYLPGLTVKGKIDLPEPKPKEPKGEGDDTDRPGRGRRDKRRRKRKDENPIATQRRREEREADAQRKKEMRQLKEKKRQHYMKTVASKAGPPPKVKKVKSTTEHRPRKSREPQPKMNALQRFWKWMNT